MKGSHPPYDPHGFRYAVRGIGRALVGERNLRFQLTAALYLLYGMRFYEQAELSRGERAVLLLCIGLVLAFEMMNTAVEYAVDLTSPRRAPLAGWAKDAAAAAVLVIALVGVAVGLLLLWNPAVFARMLDYHLARPSRLAILLLTLPLAWMWVYRGPGGRRDHEKTEEKDDR